MSLVNLLEEHPTDEYKIFLEPNMIKICYVTVTHTRTLPSMFDCSAFSEGQWIRLVSQSGSNLPVQVQRRGLKIFAQWIL